MSEYKTFERHGVTFRVTPKDHIRCQFRSKLIEIKDGILTEVQDGPKPKLTGKVKPVFESNLFEKDGVTIRAVADAHIRCHINGRLIEIKNGILTELHDGEPSKLKRWLKQWVRSPLMRFVNWPVTRVVVVPALVAAIIYVAYQLAKP